MLLAAARLDILGKVVLNDIGPKIEANGLRLLSATVGLKSVHANWPSAAAALRRELQSFYPDLNDIDWEKFARQLYRETGNGVIPYYDLSLGNTLKNIDLSEPPVALWELFAGLETIPTLALRGALSDLLSDATLREMHARHPGLESLTIANQGHAPLLWDTPTLQMIERFLA